jgi:hypothetical protein
VSGRAGLDEEASMTTKAAFTEEEWKQVLAGPPAAGMIVLTAQSGGTWSETWAMSKAYVEARQQHGSSELLDEIVSSKPKMERTSYPTPEALRKGCLQELQSSVAVLQAKATPEEVEEYERFIVHLTHKVAAAHREDGVEVSPAEQDAIEAIARTLEVPAED